MRRRFNIILFSLLILLFFILGFNYLRFYQDINACNDQGGRWNHNQKKCDRISQIKLDQLTDFYWYAAYDSLSEREILIKGNKLDSVKPSAFESIKILNRRKIPCKIVFNAIQADTIFIGITNEKFLAERKGISRVDYYIAETVFTLTENELINFVNISLNSEAHVNSGIYSRHGFQHLVYLKQ